MAQYECSYCFRNNEGYLKTIYILKYCDKSKKISLTCLGEFSKNHRRIYESRFLQALKNFGLNNYEIPEQPIIRTDGIKGKIKL